MSIHEKELANHGKDVDNFLNLRIDEAASLKTGSIQFKV